LFLVTPFTLAQGPAVPACGIANLYSSVEIDSRLFEKGSYRVHAFGMGCDEVMGSSGLFEQFMDLSDSQPLPSPWISLSDAIGAPKFSAAAGVGFRVERLSDLSYSELERECFFEWAEGYAAKLLRSDSSHPTMMYRSFEYRYYNVSNSYLAFDNDNSNINPASDVRVIYVDMTNSSDLVDVGSIADWLVTSNCR